MSACTYSECANDISKHIKCSRCNNTQFCSHDCLIKHNFENHQSTQEKIKPRLTTLKKHDKISSITDTSNYFYFKNFRFIKRQDEKLILKKATSYEIIAVKSKIDEKPYAMKIINKSKVTNFRAIKNEIRIHLSIEHDNIARLFGYSENGEHLFLILEYGEKSNLASLCKSSSSSLDEDTLKSYARCILNSLNYLYSKGVNHNNICITNYIVFESAVVKLWEFTYTEDEQSKNHVDIWSVGILIYEMTQGLSIADKFERDSSLGTNCMKHKFLKNQGWRHIKLVKYTNSSLIKLIEDLIINYESLDFKSLFQNEWINSVNRYSIIEKEGWSKIAIAKFREKLLGQELQIKKTTHAVKKESILKSSEKEEAQINPSNNQRQSVIDLVKGKNLKGTQEGQTLCTKIRSRIQKSKVFEDLDFEPKTQAIMKLSLNDLDRKIIKIKVKGSDKTVSEMKFQPNASCASRITYSERVINNPLDANSSNKSWESMHESNEHYSSSLEDINFIPLHDRRTQALTKTSFKIDLKSSGKRVIPKRTTSYQTQVKQSKVIKKQQPISTIPFAKVELSERALINKADNYNVKTNESVMIDLNSSVYKSFHFDSLSALENAINAEPTREQAKPNNQSVLESIFDYINPFRCVSNKK